MRHVAFEWLLDQAAAVDDREQRHGIVGRAAALYANGRWDEAIACYSRGVEVDERAEEQCLGLMHCCLELGRPVEGIAAFRRPEGALSRHSGSRPHLRS